MAANPRIKNSPALEDSGTDYLEPFIESTISAATRFRRVLLVLIITSVLAFGAFWNSREGSWINSRIELAKRAKPYVAQAERLTQITDELNSLQQKISQAAVGTEAYKALEQQKTILEGQQQQLQQLQEKMGDTNPNVKRWVEVKGITSMADYTVAWNQLQQESSDLNKIRIPFFGNVLDINELGLLGGFTCVVVLMWFRFTLWREYYNLNLAFDEAKEEHKEFCYKAIAIRQVLTVPPTLTDKQPPIQPWGKVVRILYFLPVIVQLAVFINDCCTFEKGWIVSKLNTIVSISASLCFLVLSIMLTYWCFQLSSDIDKTWVSASEDVRLIRAKKTTDLKPLR